MANLKAQGNDLKQNAGAAISQINPLDELRPQVEELINSGASNATIRKQLSTSSYHLNSKDINAVRKAVTEQAKVATGSAAVGAAEAVTNTIGSSITNNTPPIKKHTVRDKISDIGNGIQTKANAIYSSVTERLDKTTATGSSKIAGAASTIKSKVQSGIDTMKAAIKKNSQQTAEDAAQETVKQAAKETAKEAAKDTTEQAAKTAAKEVAEDATKKTAKGLLESAKNAKIPQIALGVGVTAWLVNKMSDSRGQQSNGQLYGQGY